MSRRWSFSRVVRTPRSSARPRAFRPLLEQLEDRLAPAVSWTGGAGTLNWNDAANWSSGAVPNATQDVVINVAVGGPITINGNDAVHSLTDTTASLVIASGSLSLATASSINHDLTLSHGTLAATGNLSVGGALTQSDGLLTGRGTVTVNGLLTWTGGTMSGSGTTKAIGGLQLGTTGAPDDSETLNGRTLLNAGSGAWTGPNTLVQEEESTFVNGPGATLTVSHGATENFGADGYGTFDNQGTLTVDDGTDATLIFTSFRNSGSVEVQSGTLHLGGQSGTITGSLTADSGATLQLGDNFNYEAYQFDSGSSVNGAGTVRFGSGVAANFASGSLFNVPGATVIDTGGNTGGNVVFAPGSTVQSVGALTVDTGVLNFSTGAVVTVATLNLTAGGSVGILTGSDTLDVSGLTTWIDGTMSGSGTTVAEGGLNLGVVDSGYHAPQLESRTFINQGTANWVGPGELDVFTGSTFVNQAGATFDETTNDTIWSDIGVGLEPSGLFDNQGTFVVEGGGTATMESRFDNEGQVEVRSGTWELSGNGGSAGDITLDDSTALQLNRFYGIPYSTDVNGDFVSSPNIINGDGSNVTLIDGSRTSPKAVVGGDLVIPSTTDSFFEVDGNVTVSSLDMTDDWLTVRGTLIVTGPMTWTGGYIAGPGTIVAEGGLQLGAKDASEELAGATLINEGMLSVAGQNVFAQDDGATVTNDTSATFDVQGDSTWVGDGTGTFDNQGTFEKSAGSGTTLLSEISLVNTGQVVADSGTLDLESGGIETGSFSVTTGNTIEFGHSWWCFSSGASVSGAGTVQFPMNYWFTDFASGSSYDVSGATLDDTGNVTFFAGSSATHVGALTLGSNSDEVQIDFSTGSAVSATSLDEQAGLLTGSDTLTVSGSTTWTGGAMSGTGTTVAQGGLQLGASGDTNDHEFLGTRTLVAVGGTLFSNDTFDQAYGSTFQIPSGATWNVQGNTSWQSAQDGSATIDNAGTLIVAAGSDTAVIVGGSGVVPFLDNNGSLEVSSGVLSLECDGIATGSFTADTLTTLQFIGTFTLFTGADVGGAGTVEFAGGDVTILSGATYDVSGITTIDGGIVEFDGSADTVTLNESSGTLTGPGTFTVSGTTTWTGGTMAGSGSTDAQGELRIGLAGDDDDAETLDGRTLTNDSAATWAGGGEFDQIDGSTFVNEAEATFTIQNDLFWGSDGTGSIENAGAFIKSTGSGVTTIETALDNTGSVQAQAATLSLQGGGTVGGTYLVLAGATLAFGNDKVTTTALALPVDFTAGPIDWASTFHGTATDTSGSGLASVGVSLFDGSNYWDGTAFESPTSHFNNAALSGASWNYTILAGDFRKNIVNAVATTATDNHGGTESSTIVSFMLSPTVPVVQSVAPAAGPLAGGSTVTISGLGLANATMVKFGDTPAAIVSDGNTVLVVTAPAGSAGTVHVTVTTAFGTSPTSTADQFTYAPAPTVSSVSPNIGVTKGGTSVTITGTNLGTASTVVVNFGSGNPATIVSDDGSTIVATSPAGAAGMVDVTVTTAGGTSAMTSGDAFTYKAPVQPSFSTLNGVIFTAGQSNSFDVMTSGFPAAALTTGGGVLPSGVHFVDHSDGTGTLSGMPAFTTGAYTFNITADNSDTDAVVQVFTLTVVDPPVISSADHFAFTVGAAGSFTVTTNPGLPTATKLANSVTLPSGLTFLDKGNGTATLSGTPAKGSGGTYHLMFTASNGASSATTQAFTLTVNQAPSFSSASSTTFMTGQAGSFTIATTGFPTVGLNETGALPSGVKFTDNSDGTATLSGTPAAGTGKNYTLTLSAGNGVLPAASQTFTLTVDQPPTISSDGNFTFTTNKAGSFTVTTTGFPTATVSHTGTLPSGLTFTSKTDGTAIISGTPAAGTGGTYPITITAANGVSPSASQLFTLTVNQPPTFSSAAAATFTVGQAGSFTVTTKGFPVAGINESGALPDGVKFTDNGDGTATLIGTPSASTGKVYTLSLSAGNTVLPNAAQTFTLTVDQPPTISSANNFTFTVGKSASFNVTTTGQVPTATTLSKTGTLPGGVTLTDNHNGTATLSGTPTAGTGGTYPITITAANGVAPAAMQSFTVTVNQPPSFSSATSTTFVVGQAGSFTVTTKGFPTSGINESGALPDGVKFTDNSDGTATLSGTPAAGTGKNYTLSLSAGNTVLPNAAQTFTLTVDQPPTITSANNFTFTVGKSASFNVTTGAGFPTTPITLKLGGTPPSGVTLTDNHNGTATLSGTPAAGTGGTYNLTITASNAAQSQTTQAFTLTVNQAPAITSARAATFTVGQAGQFVVTTSGFPAPTFDRSGVLPDGIIFTDNHDGTATLSGTPKAGTGKAYTLTIKATNSLASVTQSFTLTVNQPPIITSASTFTFTKGASNTFTITTTGFPTATITASGTLPAGVTLVDNKNGTATLSGKPTATGTFTIVIDAVDGVLPDSVQLFALIVH